jgi:hypothetical protein
MSEEKPDVDYLLKVILREIISNAGRPPQIVDIPEEGYVHSPLTIIINERTAAVLDGLREEFGTSRESVARSILHAFAMLVDTHID